MTFELNLDHLLPPFRAVAMKTLEERIAWVQQDRWIHYLRAETGPVASTRHSKVSAARGE